MTNEDLFKKTLEQYVKLGNPMLSHTSIHLLCQEHRCSENQLRQMRLSDIRNSPNYGEMARREIDRWVSSTVRNSKGKFLKHL